LIGAFLVISSVAYVIGYIVVSLTQVEESPPGSHEPSTVMTWPQDFPWTDWCLQHCFILVAVQFATLQVAVWLGFPSPDWLNTTTIVLGAIATTSLGTIGALLFEAASWLIRDFLDADSPSPGPEHQP
jgi:hypothetical protein